MSAYKTYTSCSFFELGTFHIEYILNFSIFDCYSFHVVSSIFQNSFETEFISAEISTDIFQEKKENKNRNKKKILTEHMLNKVVLFDLVRKVLMKFPHPRI